jgi:hypothetical protein
MCVMCVFCLVSSLPSPRGRLLPRGRLVQVDVRRPRGEGREDMRRLRSNGGEGRKEGGGVLVGGGGFSGASTVFDLSSLPPGL